MGTLTVSVAQLVALEQAPFTITQYVPASVAVTELIGSEVVWAVAEQDDVV